MIDHRDLDLNRRRDLEIISDLVNPGDRVLDLGCGDGQFLAHLRKERQAEVLGIEIDQDSVNSVSIEKAYRLRSADLIG